MAKRLTIVLGMHRSGTSLATNSLKIFGVDLGDMLVDPQIDNPKGFWEDIGIKKINEELLSYLGGSWDSIILIDKDYQIGLLSQFEERAISILKNKINKHSHFGFKDPRLSILLPFWQNVLSKIPVVVDYIFCFRNPLSVIDSLQKRNELTFIKSEFLWIYYNLSAMINLVNEKVFFIEYDFFIDNPEEQLRELSNFFKIASLDNEYKAFLNSFISKDFRNNCYSNLELKQNTNLKTITKDFFKLLLDSSKNKQFKIDSLLENFSIKEYKNLTESKAIIKELELREKVYSKKNENKKNVLKLKKLFESDECSVEQYESDPKKFLTENNLFDEEWYLAKNPDVKESGMDPLLHFTISGETEMRDPNPLFDSVWYKKKYPNFSDESAVPFSHFIKYGKIRKLQPSPLLDPDWYYQNYPEAELSKLNIISHFLKIGTLLQHNPCILFDSQWYEENKPSLKKIKINPLVHYITVGAKLGLDPHPLFFTKWYIENNSDLSFKNINPLVHFMTSKDFRDPNPYFLVKNYINRFSDILEKNENPLIHYIKNSKNNLSITKDFFYENELLGKTNIKTNSGVDYLSKCLKKIRPDLKNLDYRISLKPSYFKSSYNKSLEDKVLKDMSFVTLKKPLPLISIVLPTRNRKNLVERAIFSVLKQTYKNWELLIVDDGSTDNSFKTIDEKFSDERIKLFKIKATGVCFARNIALKNSTGEWIAYLDSDNYWSENFLEVMLKFALSNNYNFVYSGLERLFGEEKKYSFFEFDYNTLLKANYIDLNTIFHKRKYLDDCGGFDEKLKKVVDWDLAIRYLSYNSLASLVPFVGCYYNNFKSEDRISIKEYYNWNYFVKNKFLNTLRVKENEIVSSALIVVVPVLYEEFNLVNCIQMLLASAVSVECKIILVDPLNNKNVSEKLIFYSKYYDKIHYLSNPLLSSFSLACNFASKYCKSDYLLFLDQRIEVSLNCIEGLYNELIKSNLIAVQPFINELNLTDKSDEISDCKTFCSKTKVNKFDNYNFSYTSPFCFMIKKSNFLKFGKFNSLLLNEFEAFDFALKSKAISEFCCNDLKVYFYKLPKEVLSLKEKKINELIIEELWDSSKTQKIIDYNKSIKAQERNYQIQKSKPIISIYIAAPNNDNKKLWGDFHFAVGLLDAFNSYGYKAEIIHYNEYEKIPVSKNQVNLVLRGLKDFNLNSDCLNLIWMISHPDLVTLEELNTYDHVFCSSSKYLEKYKDLIKVGTSLLLQCTNTNIFYPGIGELNRDLDLLFVGNSRNVYRPIVKKLVEADINISVYGSKWKNFIPPNYIKGDFIDNKILGEFYRSAGVIINDHWKDMLINGFISNRIFDALACAKPVISDQIKLLPDMEGFVNIIDDNEKDITYIKKSVSSVFRESVIKKEERLKLALEIKKNHSFYNRAQNIIEVIEKKL